MIRGVVLKNHALRPNGLGSQLGRYTYFVNLRQRSGL
jgi:hypothetical protein